MRSKETSIPDWWKWEMVKREDFRKQFELSSILLGRVGQLLEQENTAYLSTLKVHFSHKQSPLRVYVYSGRLSVYWSGFFSSRSASILNM